MTDGDRIADYHSTKSILSMYACMCSCADGVYVLCVRTVCVLFYCKCLGVSGM